MGATTEAKLEYEAVIDYMNKRNTKETADGPCVRQPPMPAKITNPTSYSEDTQISDGLSLFKSASRTASGFSVNSYITVLDRLDE